MTVAAIHPAAVLTSKSALDVAAGRNLISAGAIFGAANLFQWGVMSGVLHLHPAVLSLSWPVAVAAFVVTLRQLRRSGGEANRRAALWSRLGILAQIVIALVLAVVSALTANWELMRWMSPVGLAVYGLAYAVAAIRGGPKWLVGVAIGTLAAAIGVALLVGTPAQYLAYACGLLAFALIPGLTLASRRAR